MPAQGTALGIGSGVENSNALKGQNRFVSRILFRPFRAGRILIRIGSPGRCPGLSCYGPFGAAEKRNIKTHDERFVRRRSPARGGTTFCFQNLDGFDGCDCGEDVPAETPDSIARSRGVVWKRSSVAKPTRSTKR